jgi:hypothetical protein
VDAVEWNQGDNVTKILGGGDNDVVVTVDSQLGNLNSGAVPWPDLEHTGVPTTSTTTASNYESALNLSNVVVTDANVLSYDGANQMILCFLASGGTSNCGIQVSTSISMARPQADVKASSQCPPAPRIGVLRGYVPPGNPGTPPTSSDSTPCGAHQVSAQAVAPKTPAVPIFPANERVEAMVPPHKLILAEENEIPLVIHAKGIVSVGSGQTQYHGDDGQTPDPVEGSGADLPILYHSNGSAYVKVIPMRLGKVELLLSGRFPDGGVFFKRVMLDVDPPEHKPLKLVVGQGVSPQSTSPMIFMHLAGQDRDSLNVNALYDNVKNLIAINPSFVRYIVRTRDNLPIIHLDESTGLITPVNVGHALVETWYGGKKNLTCVVVGQNIGDNYDRSRCKDLLASGEELPHPE